MTTVAVRVPGGHLNVVDEGAPSEPALVLVHAGIADLRAWDDLVPKLVVAVVGVGAGLGGFEGEVTPEELALLGQPVTRVPAAIRDEVRAMDAPQYAPGHVGGRPVPLQPPASARLAELRCPILAVAGQLDASEVAQTARHVEASAPDARAVIMPGVAHMIGMEAPDELTRLIVDFLAPLPRWS